jgi:hypothetical protein
MRRPRSRFSPSVWGLPIETAPQEGNRFLSLRHALRALGSSPAVLWGAVAQKPSGQPLIAEEETS